MAPDVTFVARPVAPPVSHLIGALRDVLSAATGVAQQVVAAAVAMPMAAVLDRVVPLVADAVISRIDITEIVIRQVDLREVVMRALDTVDLTQIVLDRVDIDAVVAGADLDEIVDRVPLVAIAEYVMQEIDLPRIIRQSTGGVATEAVGSLRLQTYDADASVARLVDRVIPWRRGRARSTEAALPEASPSEDPHPAETWTQRLREDVGLGDPQGEAR